MKEFVEYVVKALVDRPDEVAVTQQEIPEGVLFEVRCNAGDIGKVIGKSGRTIKSIRALLGAAAARRDLRAELEIVE